MDPGFTFLWHQLDSSRRHRKGCSALAAQRKGWPLREVDRKKKMELESFIEKATIELDLSAYAILIRYKWGREGEHSLVRKKVWPPAGQCSCLLHWSAMARLPSQRQSWKNSRIQGYHVPDTIWSVSCSLATYHKDIRGGYYPRFCGCGNQSSGRICPTLQKGGKERMRFVESCKGYPLGTPLGPCISSINRLL